MRRFLRQAVYAALGALGLGALIGIAAALSILIVYGLTLVFP